MKKEIIGAKIGSLIEIINSKNKILIGIKGKIIDETKNTIKIETKNKILTIIKNQIEIKTKNES